MLHLTPENTTTIEGHDFQADPIQAMRGALTDVATLGLGQLTNVFDEAEMFNKYDKSFNSAELDSGRVGDTFTFEDGNLFETLTDAIKPFVDRSAKIAVRGMQRFRDDSVPLHCDDSCIGPGLRVFGQIDGPDGSLVAVRRNNQIYNYRRLRNSNDFSPGPGAHFLLGNYLQGSLILLAESLIEPHGIETSDSGIVPLEHPIHMGWQVVEEGYRQLIGADIYIDVEGYLKNLDIPASQVRTPTNPIDI